MKRGEQDVEEINMSNMRQLYHELIVDHGRHPRNFKVLENAARTKQGLNPLCGDKLTLYLQEENGIVKEAAFQGVGCAISMASASLMTEAVKGKTLLQAQQLFDKFHQLVMNTDSAIDESLGKLMVLKGVAEYPARVKCATLAWHTLLGALENNEALITTEK